MEEATLQQDSSSLDNPAEDDSNQQEFTKLPELPTSQSSLLLSQQPTNASFTETPQLALTEPDESDKDNIIQKEQQSIDDNANHKIDETIEPEKGQEMFSSAVDEVTQENVVEAVKLKSEIIPEINGKSKEESIRETQPIMDSSISTTEASLSSKPNQSETNEQQMINLEDVFGKEKVDIEKQIETKLIIKDDDFLLKESSSTKRESAHSHSAKSSAKKSEETKTENDRPLHFPKGSQKGGVRVIDINKFFETNPPLYNKMNPNYAKEECLSTEDYRTSPQFKSKSLYYQEQETRRLKQEQQLLHHPKYFVKRAKKRPPPIVPSSLSRHSYDYRRPEVAAILKPETAPQLTKVNRLGSHFRPSTWHLLEKK